MTFKTWIVAFGDRFLSQRTFELVVEPALADLEFEQAGGRRSRIASHAAVLRAIAGGMRHDLRRGSDGFLTLTLLSACYYGLPVAMAAGLFKTWEGFFTALMVVFVMSLTPVMVCFWPSRGPVRPD